MKHWGGVIGQEDAFGVAGSAPVPQSSIPLPRKATTGRRGGWNFDTALHCSLESGRRASSSSSSVSFASISVGAGKGRASSAVSLSSYANSTPPRDLCSRWRVGLSCSRSRVNEGAAKSSLVATRSGGVDVVAKSNVSVPPKLKFFGNRKSKILTAEDDPYNGFFKQPSHNIFESCFSRSKARLPLPGAEDMRGRSDTLKSHESPVVGGSKESSGVEGDSDRDDEFERAGAAHHTAIPSSFVVRAAAGLHRVLSRAAALDAELTAAREEQIAEARRNMTEFHSHSKIDQEAIKNARRVTPAEGAVGGLGPDMVEATVKKLDPNLWGSEVSREAYAVPAEVPTEPRMGPMLPHQRLASSSSAAGGTGAPLEAHSNPFFHASSRDEADAPGAGDEGLYDGDDVVDEGFGGTAEDLDWAQMSANPLVATTAASRDDQDRTNPLFSGEYERSAVVEDEPAVEDPGELFDEDARGVAVESAPSGAGEVDESVESRDAGVTFAFDETVSGHEDTTAEGASAMTTASGSVAKTSGKQKKGFIEEHWDDDKVFTLMRRQFRMMFAKGRRMAFGTAVMQ